MNSGSQKPTGPVIPLSRRLLVHAVGEIVHGSFERDPLFSVFSPSMKRGALTSLTKARFEAEVTQWWEDVRKELKSDAQDLQIKVLCLRDDEALLRSLLAKLGVTPQAFATFGPGEKQEVYFFSDTGRLRVAPVTSVAPIHVAPAAKDASSPAASVSATRIGVPAKPRQKARVLIVDDSKTMRQLLRKIIDSSPELEVVGEAERPSQVEGLIAQLKPDVMTLDINMPEMTGVDLLRKLLPAQFIPAVMISSLSIDEGKEVLTALELGAVDYIHKPSAAEMAVVVPIIQEKIAEASRVRRRAPTTPQRGAGARSFSAGAAGSFESSRFIAVGASTGGTEAIKSVFTEFSANVPPIAVVQHIPPYFSTAFANRLNELCAFEVREAKDGDEFLPGLALVAPGGLHMEVVKEGAKLIARVFDGPAVNRFKPSVDVLFASVAKQLGAKATGVLLTGMGSDGAKGLLEMRKAGAFTIAQDQESCVVYGMPRAAAEIGAAVEVRSLEEIATALMRVKAA